MATKCLYCNDTGRTLTSPDRCEYCGKEYKRITPTKYDKLPTYIPESIKELVLDKEWTPSSVRLFIQSKGYNVLPSLNSLLEYLASITIEDKLQIIFNMSVHNYEVVFLSWTYSIFLKAINKYSSFEPVIYNSLLISDINNLIHQPIVVVELVEYNIEEESKKLMALMNIRKRKGLPTYIFSKIDCEKYFKMGCSFIYNPENLLSIKDDIVNEFIFINERTVK